jgi:2-polyprenyl-6-methoxyphenol hydroxylase-like FAD-dependent oxidoreductase
MARIIVLGAGVCGLATAMLLSRDGHEVTVLERDEGSVPESPEEAWDRWSRDGVTQFRQAHFLQSRGRAVLEEELPDVAEALEAAGAVRFDPLRLMPPSISDRAPRPGDERFVTITARRSTLEQVVGRIAEAGGRADIRRGITVRELTMRTYDGTPHVTGVRTDSGEELSGDLVVDAMGRRSQLPRLLSEAGVEPVHEESEDSGFIYYTRFFSSSNGAPPEPRAPLLTPIGSFSVLTLPGDSHTWSVALYISAGDQPLKRMRHPDRWMSLVAACPLHAHWLKGEPISDVLPMGGVVDRYRRLVVDGRRVVSGVALVADAWACTNPSLGRGIALGLLHAQRLRDVVRTHLDHPAEFSEAWDAVTEAELTPWYRETVAEDRTRLREIEALRSGIELEGPTEPADALRTAMISAVPHDAEVFRAFVASRCCLTRLGETLERSDFTDRFVDPAGEHERRPIPGPGRKELLQLLD